MTRFASRRPFRYARHPLTLAAVITAAGLAACGPKVDTSPVPNVPLSVPAGASTAPVPTAAVAPASGASGTVPDVPPHAGVTAASGAEGSRSTGTGPANGSTAIGGITAGHQGTGSGATNTGTSPAATPGDGKTPTGASAPR